MNLNYTRTLNPTLETIATSESKTVLSVVPVLDLIVKIPIVRVAREVVMEGTTV